MKFSVIYSVDCPEDENISEFVPPDLDLWDETESESGDSEGSHKKLCSILTREQFDQFIKRCGLVAERCETMGSIGAPGFGYGWAPAISFRSDNPDAFLSAYVTPLPETNKVDGNESDWRRVRKAVLAVYGWV